MRSPTVLLAGLWLFVCLGCATYSEKIESVKSRAAQGDYRGAIGDVNAALGVGSNDELPDRWGSERPLAVLELEDALGGKQGRQLDLQEPTTAGWRGPRGLLQALLQLVVIEAQGAGHLGNTAAASGPDGGVPQSRRDAGASTATPPPALELVLDVAQDVAGNEGRSLLHRLSSMREWFDNPR